MRLIGEAFLQETGPKVNPDLAFQTMRRCGLFPGQCLSEEPDGYGWTRAHPNENDCSVRAFRLTQLSE